MPDHSTLCRRQAWIAMRIPYRCLDRPRNLPVDSTSIRFRGNGEWLAPKHGATRRRERRKVHLAMDAATGEIRAVEFTPSRQGDSPILPELQSQIPACEGIEAVTADRAYDARRCHAANTEHGAEPIILIRRNGRASKPDCPAAISRNENLRATRCLGRSIWKKRAGYHARRHVEAQMNRLKLSGTGSCREPPTDRPSKPRKAPPS